MKIACHAAFACFRGALLFTVLASFADAQTQTWIRQFGTGGTDIAWAATPDGAGGVFVNGHTNGNLGGQNAGGYDAWLARYDAAGSQTWVRQIGTTEEDVAWASAPDGAGGVFVSGHTGGNLGGPNAGNEDAWLAHYNSAGSQIWIGQLGTSREDVAWAVAPDGAGGVFAIGRSRGSLGGPNAGCHDAWIARYDGAGNQTWIRQFGSPACDTAWAAAPDGVGGVFVGGYTGGSLGGQSAGSWDGWIAHYDGAGNQTWIRQLGTGSVEEARALAPDGTGGVFLIGKTQGSLGGQNAGGYDGWLAHYDGAGNQSWIRQIGTTSDDDALGAAPDEAGGVFVSGISRGSLGGPNAGDYDIWLAHYDSAGDQTWMRQFGDLYFNIAGGAAPDGAGGVFLSGYTRGNLGGPNAGSLGGFDAWLAHYSDLVATRYCSPAISNSTGQPGVLAATGTNAVPDNNLTLIASQLPANSFGFFLTSREQGSVFPVSNSQGRLCLGGFIGRFIGPGQIQNSGSTGSLSLAIDLTATPTTMGFVAVQPGDIWYFQAWHRDANPAPTSNFTDAVSVTFL